MVSTWPQILKAANEIILAIVDNSKNLYTAYWNGASLSGPAAVGGSTVLRNQAGAAVGYESTSDTAILAYGLNSAGVTYRIQMSGTNTWSGVQGTFLPSLDEVMRVQLPSDPNTDRLAGTRI